MTTKARQPQYIRQTVADGIAAVTINRPRALNALNLAAKRQLRDMIHALSSSADVHAVILTGGGDRAFCAGTDIKEMRPFSPAQAGSMFQLEYSLHEAIRAAPIPVIAAVNGYALGTGCVLAMSCDWCVASDRAVFGLPEINVGVPAAIQCALMLPSIGLARTREFAFFGDPVPATQAAAIGLINQVVPDGKLHAAARDAAARFRSRPPEALQLQKSLITSWLDEWLGRVMADSVHVAALAYASGEPERQAANFIKRHQARKPTARS